jgi:hypothetical protein
MKVKLALILAAAAAFFLTGCASTKPIPASYFGGENKMAVRVVRIPAGPSIENKSGNAGGLASAIAASINDSIERNRLIKRMGEVKPDEVVELVTSKVEAGTTGGIPIVKEGNNLLMEIEIEHWGWRRNTGLLVGPAIASLSATIDAKVSVYDVSQAKVKVAESKITGEERVGRSPQHEDLPRGLEMCAEDLAAKIHYFIKPALKK